MTTGNRAVKARRRLQYKEKYQEVQISEEQEKSRLNAFKEAERVFSILQKLDPMAELMPSALEDKPNRYEIDEHTRRMMLYEEWSDLINAALEALDLPEIVVGVIDEFELFHMGRR